MRKIFNNILPGLLILISNLIFGQTTKWEPLYSYNNISKGFIADNTIVAVADNSLLFYNIGQNNYQTVTTIDGLTGDSFSAIALYQNTVIAGFDNGLVAKIDIDTKEISFDSSIVRNQAISPEKKRINSIQIVNGLAYFATGFGIVEINPRTLAFGDTYYIGNLGVYNGGVLHATVFNENIYAATQDGLYATSLKNQDRLRFSSWGAPIALGRWVVLWEKNGVLNGGMQLNNAIKLFTLSPVLEERKVVSGELINFQQHDSGFVLTFSNSIHNFGLDFGLINKIASVDGITPNSLQLGLLKDNKTWIGTSENGLIRHDSSGQILQASPDGPMHNTIFDIEVLPKELWISHGDFTLFYNPFPLDKYGISHYADNAWLNIPNKALFEAESIVRVIPHPNEIGTLYACSFHRGIVVLKEDLPVAIWDQTNSGLEKLTYDRPGNEPSVRIRDAIVDVSGNLWTINATVKSGLKKRNSSDQWTSYDLSEVILDHTKEQGFSNIELYNNKILFFGGLKSGLIGVNVSQSPPVIKRLLGSDFGLPSEDIRSIRLDRDNRLWVGTRNGIAVLYSPNRFFEEDTKLNSIVVSDDGNLRELLSGQLITDIEVDGNNQKWISTANSGVFLTSSDGTQIIKHFTKENSPLPSSSVKTIGVDSDSGKVYFGTYSGMVSYQGDAYSESKSLSSINVFPNPVRPNFQGNVIIRDLKQNTRVKITDIAGNLVYDITSRGGSVNWNLISLSGQRVRTGVYLIFASTEDGTDSAIIKLMVIN